MLKNTDDLQDKVENLIDNNKRVLVFTGYVAGGLVTAYFVGLIFKLLASTIRSFNEFKTAIRG